MNAAARPQTAPYLWPAGRCISSLVCRDQHDFLAFQTSKYINKQLWKSHSRVHTSEIAITNVPQSEKASQLDSYFSMCFFADISCHRRLSLPPQLWSAQMADGFMLTLATARVCCCLFLHDKHDKKCLQSYFLSLVLGYWIWQPVATLITIRSKLWGNHSKLSWQIP